MLSWGEQAARRPGPAASKGSLPQLIFSSLISLWAWKMLRRLTLTSALPSALLDCVFGLLDCVFGSLLVPVGRNEGWRVASLTEWEANSASFSCRSEQASSAPICASEGSCSSGRSVGGVGVTKKKKIGPFPSIPLSRAGLEPACMMRLILHAISYSTCVQLALRNTVFKHMKRVSQRVTRHLASSAAGC